MTVKMTRSAEYPAPHSVDVHLDEVANYQAAGFILVGEPDNGAPSEGGSTRKPRAKKDAA